MILEQISYAILGLVIILIFGCIAAIITSIMKTQGGLGKALKGVGRFAILAFGCWAFGRLAFAIWNAIK